MPISSLTPWRDLARLLADAARTSTVWVTMRLDATGALAELSWQPVEAPRSILADVALVVQLRDAGWPRGGESGGIYVWAVAPGTFSDTLAAQLQRPLTDPVWGHLYAVPPVQAVTELDAARPKAPDSSDVEEGLSTGFMAGMEEGEKPEPLAEPSGMSLRTFLKTTSLIPRVAQQMVAGAAPVAPAAVAGVAAPDQSALATARVVAKLEMTRRLVFHPYEGWPPYRLEVVEALDEVSQELSKANALQAQQPPEVETAIRAVEEAASAHLREYPRSTDAALVQAGLRMPQHYRFVRTLAALQRMWHGTFQFSPRSDVVDASRLFDAYQATGGPPLITDVQRRDYLRPILRGYLEALTPDRSPRGNATITRLVNDLLQHAERLYTPFYTLEREWEITGRLGTRLQAITTQGWDTVVERIMRRWSEAGVPSKLQAGFLRAQLDRVRSYWISRPELFVDDMTLYGRLIAYQQARGWLDERAGTTPTLIWTLSPEERTAALNDPDAWMERLMQRVQAQRVEAVQDLWAQWNPQRLVPASRAWSRAEAEDVTLQATARWGGRIDTYGRLRWVPAALLHQLTLYAPASWGETVMVHWTPGERDATVTRAMPAAASGLPGVLLLDDTMPIPTAVEAMAPAMRPIVLRVHRQDLATVTHDYLAFLQAQERLRGQILLWVPLFAQPVAVDHQAFYRLATEA